MYEFIQDAPEEDIFDAWHNHSRHHHNRTYFSCRAKREEQQSSANARRKGGRRGGRKRGSDNNPEGNTDQPKRPRPEVALLNGRVTSLVRGV